VKRVGPLVQDRPANRRAPGCLAGALLAAMVLAAGVGGLVWLKRHLDPPPVRVETEAQALSPWPQPLDPIAEQAIVGSPSVSIETCPARERLYIVLQGSGLEAEQIAELASAHLASLGWQMEPEHTDIRWFDFRGAHPDSGDGSVYVGSLRDYIGDESGWRRDDRGAADQLRQLARDHHDNLAMVQIFASDDDGDC
jgi:hypothetical protein